MSIKKKPSLLKAFYQGIFQNAGDAIVLIDTQGDIIDCNSEAETILGYPCAEMIGQSLIKFFPVRIQAAYQFPQDFIKNTIDLQRRYRGQWPIQRKDGSEFPADLSISLFEMDKDNYYALILRDITEMRNIEQDLKQSQARYQSMVEDLVDTSPVALILMDSQFKVVKKNLAAAKMWDLDQNTLIDDPSGELLIKHMAGQIEDSNLFVLKVLNSYKTNQYLEKLEIHFRAKAGRNERWVLYSSLPVRVGDYAGGRVEQFVDISEVKQLLSKIEQLAITDELTGIYNRRGLFEFGERELARAHRNGSPLCAIFLDIDHFKDLNDCYGHTIGDQILYQLAQRIQRHTRKTDLFARNGGEEFVLLLPDTPPSHATHAAERIRSIVADSPFMIKGQEFSITISMGVAQLNPTDNFPDLLQKADQAMYQAKLIGRNRVEWALP